MVNKFWDSEIRFLFFFVPMDSCNLITFLSPINVSVIALLSYLPSLLILSAHALSVRRNPHVLLNPSSYVEKTSAEHLSRPRLSPFTGSGWIGYLAPLLTKHFGTLLWGEPGNLFTFITPMWVFFFCSTTTLDQQLNAYTHISWMTLNSRSASLNVSPPFHPPNQAPKPPFLTPPYSHYRDYYVLRLQLLR